ncbi:MAG: respiratory nitrate reductase subunit gamma [Granulosicoccus sp.]
MSDIALSIAFSVVFLWLPVALFYRVIVWLRSRSDLTIALAPVPFTLWGVVLRLLAEIFLFRSLWRASRITWLGCSMLHYGLLMILLMHLRFVIEVLPSWLVPFIASSGVSSALLLCGLLILFARRCFVDRVRYISVPSDYLHLLLLFSIVVTGLLLKRFWPVNLYETGQFLRGAFTLNWQALPDHTGLFVHLVLVLLLLAIFPVSKLIHGIGILFNPVYLQRDVSRKYR